MLVMPAFTASTAASRVLAYMSCALIEPEKRVTVGKKPSSRLSPDMPRNSVCHICQCVSMRPGITTRPCASIAVAPGADTFAPTATIAPSLTCTDPFSDIAELRVHGDDGGIGDDKFAARRQRHIRPFEASVDGALRKSLRHEAGGADGGQAAQKTTPAQFTHGFPLSSSGIFRILDLA